MVGVLTNSENGLIKMEKGILIFWLITCMLNIALMIPSKNWFAVAAWLSCAFAVMTIIRLKGEKC